MSKEKKNSSQIEFGLVNIDILKFALYEVEKVNIDVDIVGFNIDINGETNKPKDQINVTTKITIFKLKKDKKKKNIAELKTRFTYNVVGLSSFPSEESDINEVRIPKQLIDTLNNISISTTRGILFTKFQGTKIQNIILPLISQKELNKALEKK